MDPWYNHLLYSDDLLLKIAETLDLEERWEIFAKRTEATEDKFKPKLVTLFGVQERSVLSRMKRTRLPKLGKAASEEAKLSAQEYVDKVFDPEEWQVRFEDTAKPFVTEGFREAGQAAFTEVAAQGRFDVTNRNSQKIIQTRVFKFAKEVNETTQGKLRIALAAGFDAGESIPELSKRVANVFDIAKGSRTEMIARTEIVGASNQGTYQGYIDSEIVETKIWIATRDARTRDSHAAIDGEEVAFDKRFSNGLLHPHDPDGPAEEVINCRCTSGAGRLKE